MTFQTVGSVFHNIVLVHKILHMVQVFKRVLYILKRSKEKNHQHKTTVCLGKKHAYFLHEVQTRKGRNTEGVFLFGTFALVQTSNEKRNTEGVFLLECLHAVQEIKNVNAVKRFHF